MRKLPHPILQPSVFLKEKCGGGWKKKESLEIEDVPRLRMSLFPATNHCTLTTLTSLFSFYRRQGFVEIPGDVLELFTTIRDTAKREHLYHPRIGTFPWDMDELALRVWRQFGYEGSARNRWFFKNEVTLAAFLREEIGKGRPGMISLTSHPYPAHSLTYYGWESWERNGAQKTFLCVDDHWTDEPRYLDISWLGQGSGTYFSLCLIHP